MNKNGPLIIIEDDKDDQDIFAEIFRELNYDNEVVFFNDGQEALEYMHNSPIEPFIVFSDINMPKLSGMKLREQVHENEDIRLKTIPYLFFTTSAAQEDVVNAYSKSIQGFFIKPPSYTELKDTLRTIIEYWKKCISPNYVK